LAKANVLTGKVDSLANIDTLMRVRHPSPRILRKLEKELDKMPQIDRYWLSKWEPTFDIIGSEPDSREQLLDLMKQTMYLRHGRKSFSCSDNQDDSDETFYINFRTSVKQARMYGKKVKHGGNKYKSARFELPYKKIKLKKQGMEKPTHILNYDMGVLNEVKFYGIDGVKVKRSLLDYDTEQWFSRNLVKKIDHKGFHAAQYWARRRFICPVRCEYRYSESCRLYRRQHRLQKGLDRYRAIKKCAHSPSKRNPNFRTQYCFEITEMNQIKDMMVDAFDQWKIS